MATYRVKKKRDLIPHVIYVNEDGSQNKNPTPEAIKENVAELTFNLRVAKGDDKRALIQLAGRDKKGRPKMGNAELGIRKLMRCVDSIEGLETSTGEPIIELTLAVYDMLEGWITDSVMERLMQLEGVSEDEEGE